MTFTHDEWRLMELDDILNPDSERFVRDPGIWEMYHREKIEIMDRLGLNTLSKERPWNKKD